MPKVPVYLPISKIEINLYWEDKHTRGGNTFKTVQELADFLKDNPELAKEVGYIPKKNR